MEPQTTARWRQVKQIFQAALDLAPARRATYLADACAGDPSLLAEVESLLAAHEQPGSFMDIPAFDLAAADPAASQVNTLAGESLGRYRILELLGRGGMGEVYKAKDMALGREVAIKVLTPDLSIDRDRLRRFEREARSASALNHPNIITIHEFGREGGIYFIVSEFIEGETLRQRMVGGQMSPGAVLDIAIQVTSALNAAHEAGIVHRDIKLENIMVRPDGLVKVLDFGLAKLVEPRAVDTVADDTEATTAGWDSTKTGVVLGTVSYMSPEQARGQKLDARTDIFSLGVVLYEMASGHSPFARATAADVIASILEKEPPPLAHFTPEFPETLERIIRKALSKDRRERYQTANELLNDLKSLQSGEAVAALAPAEDKGLISAINPSWRRGAAIVLAVLVAILVAILAGAVYLNGSKRSIESIAVLPFINAEGNPETEYLADGITESAINSLAQLSNLTVRPRNSVFRYKRQDVDPLAAGRELEVAAVLTGQVTPHGDELTISLQLIDVRENRQLWGARYQRRFADLLATQAEIAREVSENLRLRLSHADEQRLAKRYTDNAEAYRAYLRGRYFWNKRSKEGFEKALAYFHQAIAIDPHYALAYSGLADCHMSMTTYGMSPPEVGFTKAKDAAQRALAIDDALAEAVTSLAHLTWLHEWDWPGGERGFKRAIALNPDYPTAHQWYSVYLSSMARHEEAIAEITRAQELDPLSINIYLDAARAFYYARQYDQAIEQCLKALEMDPGFYRISDWLELAYEQKGLYVQALEAQFKTMTTRGARPETIAALKEAYVGAGWKGYWKKRLELAKEEARERDISPYSMARIYARLGEHDQALAWLQKAWDKHSAYLVLLKVDPLLDGLRPDPRFQDLLRGVGLEP